MVTGYPSMQNAISALNKNADAFLVKPIDVEMLLTVVIRHLRLQVGERKFREE